MVLQEMWCLMHLWIISYWFIKFIYLRFYSWQRETLDYLYFATDLIWIRNQLIWTSDVYKLSIFENVKYCPGLPLLENIFFNFKILPWSASKKNEKDFVFLLRWFKTTLFCSHSFAPWKIPHKAMPFTSKIMRHPRFLWR